ncbi:ASCH domain-containing protein [Candidatus Bathyarchaeota archaeon]|nr:ASCH domain-containing protein [Candidatus Bathyarchaeota archaeon]
MAIFKRKHLTKILAGQKTQTRRIHRPISQGWQIGKTYGIRDRWFTKPQTHITILRKFRQRLGDITQEDVQKEGYTSMEEFRKVWAEIYGQWNPDQIVTVYEFKKVDEPPGLLR